MNFKLKLGFVSLSYLSQFNSKSNIQDEFWNLEIKSFHLAPRFMGLNAILIEKSPPKDLTEFIVSWLYICTYISDNLLIYIREKLVWRSCLMSLRRVSVSLHPASTQLPRLSEVVMPASSQRQSKPNWTNAKSRSQLAENTRMMLWMLWVPARRHSNNIHKR